jgi:hypothetical protein
MPTNYFQWIVTIGLGIIVVLLYSIGGTLQRIAEYAAKLNFRYGYTDEQFERERLDRIQREV